jgi:hypothetical protein
MFNSNCAALVCRHEPVLGPAVDEIDKDNATLVDANQRNQALTSDAIAAMAASGKVGTQPPVEQLLLQHGTAGGSRAQRFK